MKARYTRLLAAACAALAVLAATSPARAADAAFDAKVMKLVSTFYSYPRSAELRHEEGRAKVKIVIAGSGKTISKAAVRRSSIAKRFAFRERSEHFPRRRAGLPIRSSFPFAGRWV